MPGWEVKRKGRIFFMERSEDLLRMAVIGQIRASDEVRAVGENEWIQAGELEEVAAALQQDPWSAWESLGGQSPKALWNACTKLVDSDVENLVDDEETVEADTKTKETEPTVAPPPVSRGKQLGAKVSPPKALDDQDFSAPVTPRVALRLPTQPPIPTEPLAPAGTHSGTGEVPVSSSAAEEHIGGEIIAFPSGGGHRTGGVGAAIALDLPDISQFEQKSSPLQSRPPRRAFPWVLGTVGMVGVLTMMFVIAHVRTTAMWVSPRMVTPARTTPAIETPPAEKEIVGLVERDREIQIETPFALRQASDDLRERLSPGVIDMKGRVDDLSTALLVELSRMDLGPVKVQAPVLAWGGAHNDMPEAVDIHVLLQSRDELEWEIGAVGLVIGKYVQNYDLDVERLQVSLQSEDGSLRRIQIDPDLTRQFYRNRVDLLGFLQAL